MTPQAEAYGHANAQWPENVPPLDGAEAIAAAKRLYRKFRGRPYNGKWKLVSGNRHTWPNNHVFSVNPNRTNLKPGHPPGWHDIVHEMSHWVFYCLHPNLSPHDRRHAYLERDMIKYVVEQGWLDGRLKPKPKAAKPVTEVRYAAVLTKLAKWNTKLKRAQTAIRKLQKQKRYYERKQS